MARNVTPEKQREYNRKSYATKLGITVKQLEARRKAAREWKERNKARRTPDGYSDGETRKRAKKSEPKWWQALQIKHAAYKGTRLEKSEKPPVPLILEDI
jgi:hypothetical protein